MSIELHPSYGVCQVTYSCRHLPLQSNSENHGSPSPPQFAKCAAIYRTTRCNIGDFPSKLQRFIQKMLLPDRKISKQFPEMLQYRDHFIGVIMLIANESLREKVYIVLVPLGFITLFLSVVVGGVTAHTYFKTPSWNAARDIIREVRTKHPGITQYLEQFDTCMALREYPIDESTPRLST